MSDTVTPDAILARAHDIAVAFAAHPEVLAVALGGSRTHLRVTADARADLDLYVFTTRDVELAVRRHLVQDLGGAPTAQLDQPFWGLSDQWIDPASGVHIDVNYFDADWMQETVLRVVEGHEASLGYTTCFWRTIANAQVLADHTRWLQDLSARVDVPYPEPLRENIVALNYPVLRAIYTSYTAQAETASLRGDWVSVNHRIAALLASYFDCLFAANRVLHPGEKRLVEIAESTCAFRLPTREEEFCGVLHATSPSAARAVAARALRDAITRLLDGLDLALDRSGVRRPAP